MGIGKDAFDLLQKYTRPTDSMLELGSQQLYFNPYYLNPAKPLLETICDRHVSVDLNGEYGALKLDLQKPLNLGEFDIVTDFGTSEHIEDLYSCWKNKYDACKVGGYIISRNPLVDTWAGHGLHYFTQQFYRDLSEITSLVLVVQYINNSCVVNVMHRMSGIPFIFRLDFNKLHWHFEPRNVGNQDGSKI